MKKLEEEYMNGNNEDKVHLADIVVFVLISLLAPLTGEETLKIVVDKTQDYIDMFNLMESIKISYYH